MHKIIAVTALGVTLAALADSASSENLAVGMKVAPRAPQTSYHLCLFPKRKFQNFQSLRRFVSS